VRQSQGLTRRFIAYSASWIIWYSSSKNGGTERLSTKMCDLALHLPGIPSVESFISPDRLDRVGSDRWSRKSEWVLKSLEKQSLQVRRHFPSVANSASFVAEHKRALSSWSIRPPTRVASSCQTVSRGSEFRVSRFTSQSAPMEQCADRRSSAWNHRRGLAENESGRITSAIGDRSAKRSDGGLHGGHRVNAPRRSATGAVCSPNAAALRARSAGIPVKNEVTTQTGRTVQGKSPLEKPIPSANPRKSRTGERLSPVSRNGEIPTHSQPPPAEVSPAPL
jgi:hypothetical protein